MIDYTAPIPEPVPSYGFTPSEIVANPVEEPFVLIETGNRVVVSMQYYNRRIPCAVPRCYLRKKVYDRLLKAACRLPAGYSFKVFDAWRPFVVQQFLYDEYRDVLANKFPQLSNDDLEKAISSFVYPPVEDELYPPLHTTGGAVDLTILDSQGREIDMGTPFDAFNDAAHTRYFEDSDSIIIANNRRLLYNIMASEGFTNYPAEWWHYDFGTNLWAFYTKKPSKYLGVFTESDVVKQIK